MSTEDQISDIPEKIASFQERLIEEMENQNLTQAELLRMVKPFCKTNKVKFNKSSMSQYVNGIVDDPGIEKIGVLSMALNVSEDWLTGLDVPKERSSAEARDEDDEPEEVAKQAVVEEFGISKAEKILVRAYRAYPWAQNEVNYLLGIIDEVTWANGGTPEDAKKAKSEVNLARAEMIAHYLHHY